VSAPSSTPGSKPSRVPTPKSGHHDAQWYRRVATKASPAQPDALPQGRASDDVAWAAVSHIAAGILLYGALGWLLGLWLGNQPYFVAGGVLLGVALALFMLFRRLDPMKAEPDTLRTGPDQAAPRTEDVAPMHSHQEPPRVD
jgi:ATP synthase protein I